MGKMFQMLHPLSCGLFKRGNFCWGVHLFYYGVSTLIFQFALISFKLCFGLFLFYFVVLFSLVMGHKRGWKTGKGNGNGKVTSQEEIPNQEEGLHKTICTTQRGPSATEIEGCQPQVEGFKQLAGTKYVTRYIYVSISSSSCSSSCLLCSFSCSSSLLHLDITAYILQTIFGVITFTVTCFHLSLLHSYSI